MKNPKFSHAFEVIADLPENLAPLKRLGMNFRWSWHHETRDLFRAVDKDLWAASEHNPVHFLNSLSAERLKKLSEDPVFIARLLKCDDDLTEYIYGKTWFDESYPDNRKDTKIAYFCAEFGLTEGLPIYSGGLGILAGDHLKAASDLGIPLVGVGLLYNRGYFRQRLTFDGWQQEHYPQYDFYQMPLVLMRSADDKPIRVEVEFPDRTVSCQVWKAEVGRIQLYLMDSNVLENQPTDQGITDNLYGGDEDMRIRQEMILGIGGLRALQALGIKPTVCHMNEGHAAFQSVERIRQFMHEKGVDFRTARQVVVSGNVFTTHTPVPAGFDLFNPGLLERYMGKSIQNVGLAFNEFLKFGRFDPENQGEPFNMAVLAMENANYINGVAKLHAQVSRSMFASRWPNYPESEVPVHAVTNGVHTQTWVSRRMSNVFDEYLGPIWRKSPEEASSWAAVEGIPDEVLWEAMENQRGDMVRYVRRKLAADMQRQSSTRPEFGTLSNILDPRVMTIGFARRFATYKRGFLMAMDKERLKQILFHPERPVQIVISGKAHPRDDAGKGIIQQLVQFINNEGAKTRMVFVEDYDMGVARQLVQGVDLWLNNPRRPYEASGTSGMKVVANGGLNCSILDGWWDEGFNPGLGWAIGDRSDAGNVDHQDWLDSRALYDLIEHEITPVFYHRIEKGVPVGWIQMVKRSIMEHAPYFSTQRMVREYTERFYIPASAGYNKLTANDCARAKDALNWRARVQSAWGQVKIASVTDTAKISNALRSHCQVTAKVALNGLDPTEVKIQAIVGKVGPNRELIQTVATDLAFVNSEGNDFIFTGEIGLSQPGHMGYTVRVVPFHPDVQIPAELNLITWESPR